MIKTFKSLYSGWKYPEHWRAAVAGESVEYFYEPVSGSVGQIVELYDSHGDVIFDDNGAKIHKLMLRDVNDVNNLYTLIAEDAVPVCPVRGYVPPVGLHNKNKKVISTEMLTQAVQMIMVHGNLNAATAAVRALADGDNATIEAAMRMAEAQLESRINSIRDDQKALIEFREQLFGKR